MDELPDLQRFEKRDYVLKLVYLWLSAVGPVRTNRELAECIGVDETTVGQRLRTLKELGLVEVSAKSIRLKGVK